MARQRCSLALALLLAAGSALALVVQRLRPASGDAPVAATDAPDDEIDATESDPRRAGLGALLLLLYPAAITIAGFAPATLVFVVAGTRVCGLSWQRGLVVGGVLAGHAARGLRGLVPRRPAHPPSSRLAGTLTMHDLWLGFAAIAQPGTALALLAGSLLGIIIGVLPGVGPGVAIAAMLPLTYGVAPLGRHRAAARRLRWRLLRRRRHLHPDPHAGRGVVNHDDVRRLADGAAAARPSARCRWPSARPLSVACSARWFWPWWPSRYRR